jgi:hypothetical protein
MPRVKLTKTVIDALPISSKDIVHWDTGCPGFGVKVTPKGRKVFVVLYRTAGAGSRLRKYTIGPYGRVTLNQARVTAQKVFAAKLDGRDLAAEKKDSRRRMVADRVDELLEAFIAQHISRNRSAPEISRMLRREVGSAWGSRSIHEITKRDVIDVVSAIERRGAPVAANKALKAIKTFFRWCVGRAVLDRSPAEGVPLQTKEVARDRVLSDDNSSGSSWPQDRSAIPTAESSKCSLLRANVARKWHGASGMRWKWPAEHGSWPHNGRRMPKGMRSTYRIRPWWSSAGPIRLACSFFPDQEPLPFRTSALQSESLTNSPASPGGGFMIYDGLAYQEWRGSVSRRM